MASSSGESREACVFWLMVHSCSCSAALLIRCFLAPLLKYVCTICLLLSVQVCQLFFVVVVVYAPFISSFRCFVFLGFHFCPGVPRIRTRVVANPVEKRIYLCSPLFL